MTPDRLRWRCPPTWCARVDDLPDTPEELWGQDGVLAALRGAVATGDHQAIVVPGTWTWTEPVAAALRGLGCAAQALHTGGDALRGRGTPGLLAAFDRQTVVMDLRDLGPSGWSALREALLSGAVRPAATDGNPLPDPAPARLQVILLGPEGSWKALRDADARSQGLLARRVVAEPDLPRTKRTAGLLAERLRRGARTRPSQSALAWLMEQQARGARRGHLRVDLEQARSALGEASKGDRPSVESSWRAIEERRSSVEAFHRLRVRERVVLLGTEGKQVGVVNGLMIYGGGRQPYCVPGRITCRTSVGRQGLVNVERESKLSGRTFDKGLFQLGALIKGYFAQASPLGLTATFVFEQSYGNVDGDSATVAESVALFSELSRIPARQDLAVTGSLNQRGQVQSVGSTTRKIEGWWATCVDRGLTGTQGVVLPAANLGALQVDERVLADIEAGRFHVYAVRTLDEVLELLLDHPAGRLASSPGAGPNSIFGRANGRMRRWSERLHPPRKPADKPPAKPPSAQGKRTTSTPPDEGSGRVAK